MLSETATALVEAVPEGAPEEAETELQKMERIIAKGASRPGSAPVEAMIANIDAHFSDEHTDRAWSSDRSNFIRDTVKPFIQDGVDLRSVDCKATMCRMEAVFSDDELYREFVSNVVHSDACRECFYTKVGNTPDGRPIMNMYMSREGRPLPRIE